MATLAQKKAVVEDITSNLQGANAVYLVNYSGISVEQVNALRALFREEGITYKVYKNTLMERAMKKVGGYDSAFEHLEEQ
ncbi:MAG TPA: 50S ribosomal protein L10, partial [Balneolales bacterium]|nr:50S ribosomal protein L10 [Balneolales bacterium]